MDEISDGIWISDIQDVQQQSTKQFDAVVTICQDDVGDNIGCGYYYYPLSDGPPLPNAHNPGEFAYELFEDATETILRHVRAGDDVLVHCHAGRSRSVTAVAAALATIHDSTFESALTTVGEARSIPIDPSPKIRDFGAEFVQSK